MQHAIQYGRDSDRARLVAAVKRHLVDFSRHKFASNVVEKCLEFGADADRRVHCRLYTRAARACRHDGICFQRGVEHFSQFAHPKVHEVTD